MKRTTFVDASGNLYAAFFIAFVVLSSFLWVFQLLPGFDPTVIALPLGYSKFIYGLGGVSGIVVWAGMLLGYLRASKASLALQTIGLATHVVALLMLFTATVTAGWASTWIAGTAAILAAPHIKLLSRLIKQWARYEMLSDLYDTTQGQIQ